MGWIIIGQRVRDLNTFVMQTLTQKHTSHVVPVRVIFRVIRVFTSSIWHSRIPKTNVLKPISRFRDLPTTGGKKRDARGLLRIESRSPIDAERFFEKNAPTQTLSLGISLLESAALLESHLPELANQMQQYASVYIDGFLAAPHNPETREFVSLCECETNRVVERMSVWGSVYGAGTACGPAVLCLGEWRLTQNEQLMEWARAVGNTYLDEKFPVDRVRTEGFKIPAADAGLTLELFADLYDITGETVWLEGGIQLAEIVLDIYFPDTLPFGASGINWYESQMGPAFLIHGLARVALLALSQTAPHSCPPRAQLYRTIGTLKSKGLVACWLLTVNTFFR